MKQYKHYIPLILIGLFFLFLLIFRNNFIRLISHYQQKQLPSKQLLTIEEKLNQQYNYSQNRELFSYTFLEFGSTRCTACKNMELVMENIKARFLGKVQVVFINIGDKSNKDIVSYYGISVIPSQVILDSLGNEIFRHIGYISDTELEKQFK